MDSACSVRSPEVRQALKRAGCKAQSLAASRATLKKQNWHFAPPVRSQNLKISGVHSNGLFTFIYLAFLWSTHSQPVECQQGGATQALGLSFRQGTRQASLQPQTSVDIAWWSGPFPNILYIQLGSEWMWMVISCHSPRAWNLHKIPVKVFKHSNYM